MSTRGFLTEILLHIYRVRTSTPEENCLPDNPPCMIDLGLLPPGQLLPRKIIPRTSAPKENCPLDDCSRKITQKIIAPWKLPRGKMPFGWFVAYIIPLRKTAPRNIVLRINYILYNFSPRIRSRSTLVDSCFLLFSFFMVWISTRLWFLYKKKLYKNSETETTEKRTSQKQIEYGILKQNCVCFCNIETNKVYHRKAHKILFE